MAMCILLCVCAHVSQCGSVFCLSVVLCDWLMSFVFLELSLAFSEYGSLYGS